MCSTCVSPRNQKKNRRLRQEYQSLSALEPLSVHSFLSYRITVALCRITVLYILLWGCLGSLLPCVVPMFRVIALWLCGPKEAHVEERPKPLHWYELGWPCGPTILSKFQWVPCQHIYWKRSLLPSPGSLIPPLGSLIPSLGSLMPSQLRVTVAGIFFELLKAPPKRIPWGWSECGCGITSWVPWLQLSTKTHRHDTTLWWFLFW